jgi:hypothetical protein
MDLNCSEVSQMMRINQDKSCYTELGKMRLTTQKRALSGFLMCFGEKCSAFGMHQMWCVCVQLCALGS